MLLYNMAAWSGLENRTSSPVPNRARSQNSNPGYPGTESNSDLLFVGDALPLRTGARIVRSS